MAPTLPLLIVSLLAAGPDTGARARSPSNAERAKKGLLPRRAAPSKVTYLAEAARTPSELREFPAPAEPPVVVGSETAKPDTEEAPAADTVAAAPEPVLVAELDPALVERAAAPAGPVAAPAEPVAAPVEPVAAPAPTWTAPPPPDRDPVPAARRPSADEEPEPAPTRQARPVALFAERWVDREGRLVVRLLSPRRVVLSESVTGTVDELPVLWAGRGDNGEIVQIVEDSWGAIEVWRDPVGRFLAARTLPAYER